ncbi:SIP domain-containing protein, partial [Salmonella enterica subsp. enterica serovar Infantis]
MPALRRRLESLSSLPARPAVTALVRIHDAAYRDYLAHLTDITVEYFVGGDEQALQTRLSQLAITESDYFIWITGEGKTVKR